MKDLISIWNHLRALCMWQQLTWRAAVKWGPFPTHHDLIAFTEDHYSHECAHIERVKNGEA